MSNFPLVSVNLLTYNAQNLIEPCLNSVLEQTYPNIEILVIDNASEDRTLEQVTRYKEQETNFPIKIIENKKNLGFAAGHNIGIKESKGEYILCLNQDVVLDKDFIKNAVETMKIDRKIGAVQGKLYKAKIQDSCFIQTKILDTTGLVMFKNRRVINRGQGEKDKGQYQRGEIFGVDGAAPFYRRSALEDVKLPIFKGAAPQIISVNPRSYPHKSASIKYEYFDEDFFMYKEDVDLAWRMRLYGWKSVYEPRIIGYHLRGAGEQAVTNPIKIIQQRRKISQMAKFYSFKNQRLMQIKNELPTLFFRDFCRIIIKELSAWLYVLVFEKYSWKAIKGLIKQVPRAWKKRKIIVKRRRVGAREMAKWFQ